MFSNYLPTSVPCVGQRSWSLLFWYLCADQQINSKIRFRYSCVNQRIRIVYPFFYQFVVCVEFPATSVGIWGLLFWYLCVDQQINSRVRFRYSCANQRIRIVYPLFLSIVVWWIFRCISLVSEPPSLPLC